MEAINTTMGLYLCLSLALGLTFLSAWRLGSWGWFITTFAWIGFAAAVDSTFPSSVAIFMAFLCLVFFVKGATRK